MSFVIRFDFPESAQPIYAGWTGDGTLGYAPTLKTAGEWEDEATAKRVLEASYGPETASYGRVLHRDLA